MVDDRIDIIVDDKGISPAAATKIKAIATAARSAHSALEAMTRQLSLINTAGLDRAAAASAKLIGAQARQTSATARLTNATARQDLASVKLAISQQKLAVETARTQQAQARASAEMQKSSTSIIRHQIEIERLAAARRRAEAATRAQTAAEQLSNRVRETGSRSRRQQIQQTQNLVFQLNDIAVSLASGQRPATVLLQQGSQIATIYGPGKGVLGVFKEIGIVLGGIARTLAVPLTVVGLLGGAFVSLHTDIKEATKANVTFGDTFKAIFQVLGKNFGDSTVGKFFSDALDGIKIIFHELLLITKDVINSMIGLFAFGAKSIGIVFSNFPTVFKSLFTAAFNGAISIVNFFIEGAIDKLNLLIELTNKAAGTLGFNNVLNPVSSSSIPLLGTPDGQKELAQQFRDAFREIEAKDYLGAFGDDVRKQAILNAITPDPKEVEQRLKDSYDVIERIVADTRTPLEIYERRVRELEALRPFAKTAEDRDALRRAFLDANIELEKAVEQTNTFGALFEDVAKGIGEQSTAMFRGMLDGAAQFKLSFKSIATSVFDTFKDMIARMATLAIARPVLIPLVTAIGGSLGVGRSSIDAVAQELGGERAATGVQGLSTLSNVLSLSKTLGTPLVGSGPSFLKNSPLLSGGFNNLTTLGGVVSGFAGNFLANSLFGDRGVGAGVGGGLGSVGGAIGAAALGLGPIGAALAIGGGSFLGNALGGLFGGKASVPQGSFVSNIGTGNQFDADRIATKNLDSAKIKQLFSSSQGVLAALQGSGIDVAGQRVSGGFLGGKGFFELLDTNQDVGRRELASLGKRIEFGSDDEASNALGRLAVELVRASGASGSLAIALNNMTTEGRKVEEIISDIQFARAFDQLSFIPAQFTELEVTLQSLTKQTQEAAVTAKRLGLEEAKIYAARDKAVENARAEFNKDIQQRILQLVDPRSAALQELDTTFAAITRDAIAAGGDLLQLERYYQLERSRIIEEFSADQNSALRSAYADIRRFRESLLVSSSVSGLSSEERRREALRQFTNVQERFASGDATFDDVQSAVSELLSASKDYFSFSSGYFNDFNMATGYLEQIENNALSTLTLAERQFNESAGQTALLQDIRDAVTKNLVSAAGLGQDARLLRSGESFSDLQAAFNTKNMLPELLVRQFKLQAGFDFSKASPSQNFANFASPAQLSLFNQLVERAGGVPQFAAGGSFMVGGAGGTDSQLVRFRASPNERVTIETPEQQQRRAANDNRVSDLERQVTRLQRVIAEQGDTSNELLTEIADRLAAIDRVANRNTRKK